MKNKYETSNVIEAKRLVNLLTTFNTGNILDNKELSSTLLNWDYAMNDYLPDDEARGHVKVLILDEWVKDEEIAKLLADKCDYRIDELVEDQATAVVDTAYTDLLKPALEAIAESTRRVVYDMVYSSIVSWEAFMMGMYRQPFDVADSFTIRRQVGGRTYYRHFVGDTELDYDKAIFKIMEPILEGIATTNYVAEHGSWDGIENVAESLLYHTVKLYSVLNRALSEDIPDINIEADLKGLVWDAFTKYDLSLDDNTGDLYDRFIEICEEFGVDTDYELMDWPNLSRGH